MAASKLLFLALLAFLAAPSCLAIRKDERSKLGSASPSLMRSCCHGSGLCMGRRKHDLKAEVLFLSLLAAFPQIASFNASRQFKITIQRYNKAAPGPWGLEKAPCLHGVRKLPCVLLHVF